MISTVRLGRLAGLESAVQRLTESEYNRALVLGDRRLAGLLSITDAARLIEARRLVATTNSDRRRGR